jgi:hypothetical protein
MVLMLILVLGVIVVIAVIALFLVKEYREEKRLRDKDLLD